ncbi:MAG: hypothetical protein HY420_02780 [Candidatus Kerfeldbacteria bacterium]|nr:hypothetical protein [Candidatus Kerfeldbacteria bacterium]
MFDYPWSLIHAISGLIIGLLLKRLPPRKAVTSRLAFGVAILVLWEILEMLLRTINRSLPILASDLQRVVPRAFFAPESVANVAGDLIVGTAGLLVSSLPISRLFRSRS